MLLRLTRCTRIGWHSPPAANLRCPGNQRGPRMTPRATRSWTSPIRVRLLAPIRGGRVSIWRKVSMLPTRQTPRRHVKRVSVYRRPYLRPAYVSRYLPRPQFPSCLAKARRRRGTFYYLPPCLRILYPSAPSATHYTNEIPGRRAEHV